MATLITSIAPTVFPHELEEFELEGHPNEDFTLSIAFGGKEVYSAHLTLDLEGGLTLDRMDALIRTYATAPVTRMQVGINGSTIASCDVLRCDARLDQTAKAFCAGHFLTRRERQRVTPDGSLDFAFYADAQPVPLIIRAITLHGNTIATHTVKTTTVTQTGTVVFSESVAKLTAALTEEVLALDVTAGSRSMRFDVFQPEPGAVYPVRFRNCFGAWETLYFWQWTVKHITEFETAMIGGRSRNVSAKTRREIKCTLPQMSDEEVDSLEDLTGSHEVVATSTGAELTPLNLDFQHFCSPTRPTTGTITLRESAAVPLAKVTELARTFDHTFDQSFN